MSTSGSELQDTSIGAFRSGERERDGDTPSYRYRWAILFTTWLSFLLSYVDRVAWSSVAAPVGHSMGIPVTLLGAFVTAFYIGYVVSNITGGVITDTVGSRRTLTYALIPLGIATYCFGFVHSLALGIVVQVCMGLAAGADYAAGMKIIATWFDKDRGLAMGIYGTATSLAIIIGNATVPRISLVYGWPTAFHLLGVATFLWAIVCFLVLRDAPLKIPNASITRAEIVQLFKNRNLILIALAGFWGFWATVGFGSWGNALMTKQYGITPVVAGSILASFGVGAIVAKPLLGWIRDLIGPKSQKVLPVACLLFFSLMLVVFGRCSTTTQFFLVAPVLGATAFGYTPLLYVLLTEASGVRAAGAASGLTNAIWQFGSTLSPLAVGLVFGHLHSFQFALGTLALGPLVAALLLCLLKPQQTT